MVENLNKRVGGLNAAIFTAARSYNPENVFSVDVIKAYFKTVRNARKNPYSDEGRKFYGDLQKYAETETFKKATISLFGKKIDIPYFSRSGYNQTVEMKNKQHHIAQQQIKDRKDQYHKEWDNFQNAVGEFETFLSDQQKNCLGLEGQLKSFEEEKNAISVPEGSKYADKLSKINNRYQELLNKIREQNKSVARFNADLNNVRQNIFETAPTQDQNLSVCQQFDEAIHEKVGQIGHEINKTFGGAEGISLQAEINALKTDLQNLKNQQIRDLYASKWDQLRANVGTQENSLKTLQKSCSNLQEQLMSLQDLKNYVGQKLQGTETLSKLNEQHNTVADKLQQQQSAANEISNKLQLLQASINTSQSQLMSADNIDEAELQRQDAFILEQFRQIQQEIEHLGESKLQPAIDQLKTNLNEQLRQMLQQDLDAAKATCEGCTSSMDSYMSYVQPFHDAPIGYLEELKSGAHNTQKFEEGIQKLKEAYDRFANNFQSYNQAKSKVQSAIEHLESLIGSGNIREIQESEKAVEQTVTEFRNTFAKLDENIQGLFTEYRANVAGILEEVLKEVPKDTIQALLTEAPQAMKDLFAKIGKQSERSNKRQRFGW
ncbi:MAG: hypothetical protein LW808_002080 [Verrucomicrobiota bacterium]|nr:MAG: hypothetical protein LW808_002080 [Verrucomicrobiota bacterium]